MSTSPTELESALAKAKERTAHARTALEEAVMHLEDCVRAEALFEVLDVKAKQEVAGG